MPAKSHGLCSSYSASLSAWMPGRYVYDSAWVVFDPNGTVVSDLLCLQVLCVLCGGRGAMEETLRCKWYEFLHDAPSSESTDLGISTCSLSCASLLLHVSLATAYASDTPHVTLLCFPEFRITLIRDRSGHISRAGSLRDLEPEQLSLSIHQSLSLPLLYIIL